MASSTAPWTQEEKDTISKHYGRLGAYGVQSMIPRRSPHAIRAMARVLDAKCETPTRKVRAKRDEAEEEKLIIVEETRRLIESICANDPPKLEKALLFLRMISEANSAEWFYERKHLRLGAWCEMFIDGYEWKPIYLVRDEFLSSDGTFGESKVRDEFKIHR